MYCVFCGKPDVISCQRCGRFVCPRHVRRWRSRKVCVGCQRRLLQVLAAQAVVAGIAVGIIGLTVFFAMNPW